MAKYEKKEPEVYSELLSASMEGNVNRVKELLAMPDIDVHSTDNNQRTALHFAAYFNEVEIMRLLINKDPSLLLARSHRGHTPLIYGALVNACDAVRYFLSLDSVHTFLNEQNTWKETALHVAASAGHSETCRILCESKGCNLNIRDNWKQTALRVAHVNGEKKAFEVIKEYCNDELIQNALKGEDDDDDSNTKVCITSNVLREYREQLAERMKQIQTSTALKTLTKERHTFEVKGRVVEKSEIKTTKASSQKKKKHGLSHRFEYGSVTLEQIQDWCHNADKYEINVDGCDFFKLTALHKAAMWHKPRFVEELLIWMSEAGVNAVDTDGNTALHMVCKEPSVEVIRLLCANVKVKKDITNAKNQTPLDIAQALLTQIDAKQNQRGFELMTEVVKILREAK